VSVSYNLLVTPESSRDKAAIRAINQAAFGQPDEADLVEKLHEEGAVLLSLVARVSGIAIGHILFTRMFLDTETGSLPAVALAPLAVLPEWQRKGVGSQLIRQGLFLLRHKQESLVIVVGDPAYYGRFGFASDKALGLASPFPPEFLQVLELRPGALDGVAGKVRYPKAFGLE
jgi:putative acetyltransferase